MSKGGLAAVRELIASRFKKVHGDVRDATQVRASREMAAEIEKPVEPLAEVREHIERQFERVHSDLAQAFHKIKPAQVEKSSLTYSEHDERVFRTRAKSLSHAALRSGHVAHSYRTLRSDLHRCYEIEVPMESAAELFAAALKRLEGK